MVNADMCMMSPMYEPDYLGLDLDLNSDLAPDQGLDLDLDSDLG